MLESSEKYIIVLCHVYFNFPFIHYKLKPKLVCDLAIKYKNILWLVP